MFLQYRNYSIGLSIGQKTCFPSEKMWGTQKQYFVINGRIKIKKLHNLSSYIKYDTPLDFLFFHKV